MSVFRRSERLAEEVHLQEIEERHDLAQQIFLLREHRGWTQEKLALRSGLTQSQVAQLEAGHANPTLRTVVKIAYGFGRRVWELLRPAEESSNVLGSCGEQATYAVSVGGNVGPGNERISWQEVEGAFDTFLRTNLAVLVEEERLQRSLFGENQVISATHPARSLPTPTARMSYLGPSSREETVVVPDHRRAGAA